MTRLLSTLALAFALLASLSNSSQAVELNGFVAGSYFKSQNTLPFDTINVGVGARQKITDTVTLYGSVNANQIGAHVSSAFVMVEYPFDTGWELTGYFGRIRNCFCLYNYTRFHPGTKDPIVLPQSMYWDVLEDLAGYTDGASVKLGTPIGIQLNAAAGKNDIHSSRHINNTLFIPGVIASHANVRKYGIGYESETWSVGTQTIRWDLNSSYVGNTWVNVDDYYVRYDSRHYSVSAEKLFLSTQLSRMMGMRDAESYSLTFRAYLTDKLSWFINRNEVDYKNKDLELLYPGKSKTVDWNTGVRYRIQPNTTIKAEYHHVNGTSWLDQTKNVRPSTKNDIYGVQVVYEF